MRHLDRDGVLDRFWEAFPKNAPVRIAGGGGAVARVRNVSMIVGDRSWINVHWVPFGDAGVEEFATIPATFEGFPVNCHRTSNVPLTPVELAMDAFAASYYGQQTGTIEDGDGTRVRISRLTLSGNVAEHLVATYGCPSGEVAILADWVPSEAVAVGAATTIFPRRFHDVPVYYRCGSNVVAHSTAAH